MIYNSYRELNGRYRKRHNMIIVIVTDLTDLNARNRNPKKRNDSRNVFDIENKTIMLFIRTINWSEYAFAFTPTETSSCSLSIEFQSWIIATRMQAIQLFFKYFDTT